MQKGDISNEEAPRIVFVFERMIGYLPQNMERMELAYRKAHRWAKAVDCWDIPERVQALLWDLTWRWQMRFDVVTFRPEKFAAVLRDRLNEENVPVGNLWADTPERFVHRLTFLPSVNRVYDSDPQRQLAYGGRGVHIPGGLASVNSLW